MDLGSTEPPVSKIVNIFKKIDEGIRNNPQEILKINALYLFKISGEEGGVFHIDLKENPGVSFEEKPADCTLLIKDRDFIKIVKGVLPGFKAMLLGKLKVEGNLQLATKLNDIFMIARQEHKKRS